MKTKVHKPTKPARTTKKPVKPEITKVEVELSPEDLEKTTGGSGPIASGASLGLD
jgi:hypothetical protein